jgi:archaetidylinositol phosphate synthase
MAQKRDDHIRINNMLLGALERPALRWLAAHMPAWVTPDLMTITGALGSVIVGASFWASNYYRGFLWLACVGFIINWFGDSLDGTLARYRHIERPRYGFFIDHSVDAMSQVVVLFGMGISYYMRFDIACFTLIGYLLLSIMSYLQTIVFGEFHVSYVRLGPTEVRLIGIIGTILVFFFGTSSIHLPRLSLTFLDAIGIILTVLMGGAFLVMTIQQSVQLAKEERPRKVE